MGFDTPAAAVPIVRVPFIGMDPRHARVVARDFAGLFATFVECSGNGNVTDRFPTGWSLFEITPVLLGDDPSDPKKQNLADKGSNTSTQCDFGTGLWMIFASKRSLGLSASAIRVRPSITQTPRVSLALNPGYKIWRMRIAQMLR